MNGFSVGLNLKVIALIISIWVFNFNRSSSETFFLFGVNFPFIVSCLYDSLSQKLRSFFKRFRIFFPRVFRALISNSSLKPVNFKHGEELPRLNSPYFATISADSSKIECFFLP